MAIAIATHSGMTCEEFDQIVRDWIATTKHPVTGLAADKAGHVCRGVEFDPLYVDVIIRRYEAATGEAAALVDTGESFRDLAARRAGDLGCREQCPDAGV